MSVKADATVITYPHRLLALARKLIGDAAVAHNRPCHRRHADSQSTTRATMASAARESSQARPRQTEGCRGNPWGKPESGTGRV